MDDISFLVALSGGFLSIFSPCVLPMIPVYLASLAGPEIFEKGLTGRRLTIFWHGLGFIAGFSIVFVGLGTLAGLTGLVISSYSGTVRWLSGGLMIVFGVFMLAAPHIPWLNYEKRLAPTTGRATGYLRSILLGIIFALAWTPCVGPVLGGILALALSSESVWQGTYLLAFYSLGLAVPFIIIGLAFQFVQPVVEWIKRFSRYVYMVSGALLIGIGILILLNRLVLFNW
ncbi:MAG TPA: cytochrome c biogenesis CcdA family protein [Dehalococcoidales bacterium]|nr:cytochrome c biogenesis CcdA family protein [Dehalococcoidales bacterium]